jgi:hypothetical protein
MNPANPHIPTQINAVAVLDELNKLGWRDTKIEVACGFSKGYVSQLRSGYVHTPSFPNAALLLNLLEQERAMDRAKRIGGYFVGATL